MNFSRQERIFDPKRVEGVRFHFIGLGAAGSAALLSCAKLGIRRFVLWDPDIVTPENVPTQLLYDHVDVSLDLPKVEAAKKKVLAINPEAEVRIHQRHFSVRNALDGFVISGVDSITVREMVWRAVVRQHHRIALYIDQRLAGEYFTLLTVDPSRADERRSYKKDHLFPQDEAAVDPCGATGIIHPALLQAALVAGQIVRVIRGEEYYRLILGSLSRPQNIQFISPAIWQDS